MITKDTKLSTVLELGFKCSQCGHCCKHGTGALVGDDLKRIAGFLKISEKKLKQKYLEPVEKFNTRLLRPKTRTKPFGTCIFHSNGCTIHPVKPLECKIGNCNEHGEELSLWFMLNYFVNKHDPESIRQYASYLKLEGKTLKGGKLQDLVPSRIKLKKILSYEVLR